MKDFLNALLVTCKSYLFFGFFDGRISSLFSRRRLKRLTCCFHLENRWKVCSALCDGPPTWLTKLSPVLRGSCMAGWQNSNPRCSSYFVFLSPFFRFPFLGDVSDCRIPRPVQSRFVDFSTILQCTSCHICGLSFIKTMSALNNTNDFISITESW